MASDRNWMYRRFDSRNNITEEYMFGVQDFIKVALKENVDSKGRIKCPCKECGNTWSKLPENVTYDLYRYGIMESYTKWIFHGEKRGSRVEAETSSEVVSKKNSISNDDALQNAVSNTSSSHVEPMIIHDPTNFFVDLRFVENDNSVEDYNYNEEHNNNNDNDMSVEEESESDDDVVV
ncbi:hypothetical protein POM88_031417 [Heracleum sosnowskyi]|uniref:Transposase-associated domain-containing protein n=1 Tax=Heracleum sosnowskyi TaxID=360622 RepID=A0AAD8HYK8_9APIA|nr:hypothetical protein POM88_031417 [Heracleum sosnowskyi]